MENTIKWLDSRMNVTAIIWNGKNGFNVNLQ